MSTKSSILYDEPTDIHIYYDHLDKKYYISDRSEKILLTGKIKKMIQKARGESKFILYL